MLFDKNEELYSKQPANEEEARVQLIEIYDDMADKLSVSARKNAFSYAILTSIGVGSIIACKLLGLNEDTVHHASELAIFTNSIGGMYFIRNLIASIRMKRDALKQKEAALNHELTDCMERVQSALNLANNNTEGKMKI